jgi:Holliday junction resolvase RusA-like endonuclease
MEQTINIKPLSVNLAWQGKRFKTPIYKKYEKALLLMLKKKIAVPEKMAINFEFGFSNVSSDIDNPVKPFLDILQKKYKFNDSKVYQLNIKKTLVKKGKEFIKFQIIDLDLI